MSIEQSTSAPNLRPARTIRNPADVAAILTGPEAPPAKAPGLQHRYVLQIADVVTLAASAALGTRSAEQEL